MIQSTFTSLPILEQAEVLINLDSLTEKQIKRLHKIHLQLPSDNETKEIKSIVKQRLVSLV